MVKQKSVNPIHPDVLSKLDPAFVNLYNVNLAHIAPRAPDLEALRKVYSTQFSYATAPSPECAKEYDEEVDGWDRYPGKIKIRIYVPQGVAPQTGWPVHIDFHGGGWGLGDLDTEAHVLRHICTEASVLVVDVDYRLIPEFPFPTAIYDSFEVLKAVHTSPAFANKHNINPGSISLGGLSAGANIALILCHLARDYDSYPIPIKVVIAGCPVLADISSFTKPEDSPFPSMTEMAKAPTLNWLRLQWFDKLKSSSLLQPEITAPADLDQQAQDLSWFRDALTATSHKSLADFTYIATAGCDPLRDEGEAYGRLLQTEGNIVKIKCFPGVPHPFQHMDAVLPQAREFISDACKYIREAHYAPLPAYIHVRGNRRASVSTARNTASRGGAEGGNYVHEEAGIDWEGVEGHIVEQGCCMPFAARAFQNRGFTS